MEFKRDMEPSAKFSVPDVITVRQQLAYFGDAILPGKPTFERLWVGALPLITDWECEIMPDKEINLDEVSDPALTDIIVWAGVQVKKHIDSLSEIKKN